ncbi:MAG: A24 family peptidase [Pirellulales bacterium]
MIPTFFLVACGIAVAASITDVWRFKVYNALTFPAMALGVAYHALAPQGQGAFYGVSGMLVGMGVLIIPYALGAFGAGDAKFIGAIGAWIGVQPVLTAMMVGALVSGLYALVLLVFRGGGKRAWSNLQLTLLSVMTLGRAGGPQLQNETVQEIARTPNRRQRLIPFSAMIGVGVLYAAFTMALT